jgi:hypothetical protein
MANDSQNVPGMALDTRPEGGIHVFCRLRDAHSKPGSLSHWIPSHKHRRDLDGGTGGMGWETMQEAEAGN